MIFSGSFSFASGSFLTASPLIINCSYLPFGTQERLWRLESAPYKERTGHRKASVPRGSTVSCSASVLSQRKSFCGRENLPCILQLQGTWRSQLLHFEIHHVFSLRPCAPQSTSSQQVSVFETLGQTSPNFGLMAPQILWEHFQGSW